MQLKVNIFSTINKSQNEVFQAIINQNQLTGYFISRASDSIKEGETITWFFDDVGAKLKVKILKVEENQRIEFEWSASGIPAKVEIILERENDEKTKIQITETGWEMTESGIQSLVQQTQGWTDFICSLKAFLYTGINLRNGTKRAPHS